VDATRLGAVGDGFKVAMSALDNGRISLAAGCVGIAAGCLAASIGYARERTQFGKPVASFQLVQELIADIAVETEAARLLSWRAATLADRGEPHTLESSLAKYYARRTRPCRCMEATVTSTSIPLGSTSATRG
jgi:alkylation response protein AidB-like acyl-CoA dehydrogenase